MTLMTEQELYTKYGLSPEECDPVALYERMSALKSFVYSVIGTKNVVRLIRDKLRSDYRFIWSVVRTGTKQGGWSKTELFVLLGIPHFGECESCGMKSRLTRILEPARFCSKKCIWKFNNSNEDIKRKQKDSLSKNWKNGHPARDPDFISRKLLKYGEDPLNSESAHRTRQAVFDAKFQGGNPMSDTWIKSKSLRTRQKIWQTQGHHMQNPEVFSKTRSSLFSSKTFKSKTSGVHYCQGYEPVVLEFLESNENVLQFTTDPRKVPVVSYIRDGKRHSYFPDIAVCLRDSRKLLIEVKSKFTLGRELEANIAKFKAASASSRERGWKFWLALVDSSRKITWVREPTVSQLRSLLTT